MDFDLVVISPFAAHTVGTRITDPVLIAEILADERAALVQKVAPLAPAPKPGKPA